MADPQTLSTTVGDLEKSSETNIEYGEADLYHVGERGRIHPRCQIRQCFRAALEDDKRWFDHSDSPAQC